MSNDDCDGIEGVAVVIDVLRAFSFAAYAFGAGADRIILMENLEETLALAKSIPGALAAKDGVPAPGFDLFNSPGQLLERDDIDGRVIVQRTSAGTVGAVAARHADHLLCASFVVASATVDRIRSFSPTMVTFVITGGGGKSDDDLACGEYLEQRLRDLQPDPRPYLARADAVGDGLRRGVELGYKGVHRDDVTLCCEIDRFPFALRATDEEGHLVLRPD